MMRAESDVAARRPSQTNRWSFEPQLFNIETSHGVFSKLKLSSTNPQRLDSSVEPAVVCVVGLAVTLSASSGLSTTQKDRASVRCTMGQGSGAQRRPVGGSPWPRGVSAHHMECVGQPGSHVRTSCGSDFTRPFRRFSADWDSSRRCSSSSEHNHGPRGKKCRTYFPSQALFFEYRSNELVQMKWVRSIRRVPPDRSHLVLAQTDKFKCSNAEIRVQIPV